MINHKKKNCKHCGKETYIYARGLCQFCYQKDYAIRYRQKQKKKPRKRLKPIADKRAKELSIYRKERDKYMKEHPICEAHLPGCTIKATDLHHLRKRRGSNLYNPEYFMAVCRLCHNHIEDQLSFEEAERLGLRVKSI